MAAGMMLLITSLRAADQVVVYVDDNGVVEDAMMHRAQYLAGRMFAKIDVSIKWRAGQPPRGDREAMAVSLVSGRPKQFYPGALGYATISPHSPGRVFVFTDRLRKTVEPDLVPPLLAHVLVHEITHVLEGVNRHSETGVMKAHWTRDDHRAMAYRPLEFAPVDVEMIHSRLARR
jgi:hypothetical protein